MPLKHVVIRQLPTFFFLRKYIYFYTPQDVLSGRQVGVAFVWSSSTFADDWVSFVTHLTIKVSVFQDGLDKFLSASITISFVNIFHSYQKVHRDVLSIKILQDDNFHVTGLSVVSSHSAHLAKVMHHVSERLLQQR